MTRILDWLDSRTGYRGMVSAMLYEHIPGGARWRYVWGSTLMFCFATQVITGLFLWAAYSPSSQTAWESVYYIQNELWGGWLVRGIHHFTAQAMIVLLALHMLQVIIDGAYKAPREINFWIGLILMQIVLGLSLTGYLLPWDQKGYWATKVATSLMEAVPLVGPTVQKIVIGGHDYGHHTLTRFFALHAGLLPGLMIVMIVAHIYAFRKHGITAKLAPDRPDSHFWPDQVLKDAVACLAVLAAVLFLVFYFGAPLSAPADPTEPFSAARPEWYFLFLFQFLKYFPGESELIGAIVIPGLVMGLFFIMPFIGKVKMGHAFNVLFIFALLGGAGYLTFEAMRQDAGSPDLQLAVKQAHAAGERAAVLAHRGIPDTGARTLMRGDPKTMGPKLFAANCASCHRYDGHDGLAGDLVGKLGLEHSLNQSLYKLGIHTIRDLRAADTATLGSLSDAERGQISLALEKALPVAADLHDYHGKKWLTDFFDPKAITTHRVFGGTKFAKGKMVKKVTDEYAKFDEDEKKKLAELIDKLAIVAQYDDDDATAINEKSSPPVKANIEALGKLMDDTNGLSCKDCHTFYGEGKKSAPDLTGYRSVAWIKKIIHDPKSVNYKNKTNDKGEVETKDNLYTMPAFGATGQLEPAEIDLLARWLHGQWYEPAAAKAGE
jgi:ubiquinol-cytochrome c reductase cytochrome b subunit